MKETKPNAPTQQEKDHAVDHLPGAAVDHANKNKVSEKLVDERTCTLNNNARNQK